MLMPLTVPDLVANESVTCRKVRDTKQGLRQAHQGDTLLRGEIVFLHQILNDAATAALTKSFDQTPCCLTGEGSLIVLKASLTRKRRHPRGFRYPGVVGDGLT
ncbi:hypothetical protein AA0229_0462 [Gluconobacter cerinus NRIC 0229]|nr:hypothetical protein AA0229_0462 [Gluconobacter cerinus NRIC 0229]